jgi:N-acetylmuramoyl-L-alanine amidase
MVIDLAKPARIDRAFVLEPSNDQPARLVLDLTAVDRETFLRAIALENRAAVSGRRRPAPQTPEEKADTRPLIVVDPGHGGIDNGTQAASGELEKSIVLQFSLALREHIEKNGKYRVLMTRTDDTFIPLAERVNIARARQAGLFISVHADALARGDGDAQGATIYTLSETASDAAAAQLAESENRADAIAGLDLSTEPDDVAGILYDLALRETKTFSVQFARALVSEMRNATRMHKEPLRSAGFRVLKAPDVPSVLVELGYVSNRGDLKSLTSEAWRNRTAASIARAVDAYFVKRVVAGGR